MLVPKIKLWSLQVPVQSQYPRNFWFPLYTSISILNYQSMTQLISISSPQSVCVGGCLSFLPNTLTASSSCPSIYVCSLEQETWKIRKSCLKRICKILVKSEVKWKYNWPSFYCNRQIKDCTLLKTRKGRTPSTSQTLSKQSYQTVSSLPLPHVLLCLPQEPTSSFLPVFSFLGLRF